MLEKDALTKVVKLPKSFSKTIQFFHREKPKGDGSRICANVRILHTEDTQIIIGGLRYHLEELEITVGL